MFCSLEKAQQYEHYSFKPPQKLNLLTMKFQGFALHRISCVCATEVSNTIHSDICWASCPQASAISWKWYLFHRMRLDFFYYCSSYHPRYTHQELILILCVSVCSHMRAISECDQRIGPLANKANILQKDISGNVNCPDKESLHVWNI